MVRTTMELVPLLASVLVSAPGGAIYHQPGWAFEPCHAVAGDTLRCGKQVVRVRGVEADPPGTEAGGRALDKLQRKIMEGRVRIEPVAVSVTSRHPAAAPGQPGATASGPALVANVYVSEARLTQRHIGDLPAVDVTDCDVLDANSLKCGTELLRIRGISAAGKSAAALTRARQWLETFMQSGEVKLVRHARDHYGRVIVELYVDGSRVRCGVRNSRRTC